MNTDCGINLCVLIRVKCLYNRVFIAPLSMTTLKFIMGSYLYYFPLLFILVKPFEYKRLFLCKFFSSEDLNTNKKLRGHNPNAEKLKGFIRMKSKVIFSLCMGKQALYVCGMSDFAL